MRLDTYESNFCSGFDENTLTVEEETDDERTEDTGKVGEER